MIRAAQHQKKLQTVGFIVPKCLDSGWSESITVNIPKTHYRFALLESHIPDWKKVKDELELKFG